MNQEAEIMYLLRNGNKLGLEMLFKKFYRPLVVYASKFVNEVQEAEDLVQEVLISLWEEDKFLLIKTHLGSYLYSSVKNRCLNNLRAASKVLRCDIDDYTNTLFEAFPDDEIFALKITAIKKAVGNLPKRTRDILMAVYFHKLSYNEVAEEFGISKNTVKTTLTRAMKTLRAHLTAAAFLLLALQM